ncbi:receptor-like protein EIX1 [Beta vulgaris subsp. vulgaris]|uniref:receptor-like protein EIX1 n=1 Tax=Beta vulgaris subsp. vulgaris TaxID=3555 RepID=UPI0020375818|nr:receptor-like protein EIX1 [Beta vulgaris subsp. vulgaris]
MKKSFVIVCLLFISLHFSKVLCCHKPEQEALSMFKLSFSDPSNRLSSWIGEDCCHWKGVICNNVTGYINQLDLRAKPVWNFAEPLSFKVASYQLQAKELDPCLVELRHLNYLDLSGNDFQRTQIPEFIGSFKHLRYLNLSMASFWGVLPPQLGNLTSLEALDLDSSNLYGSRINSDLGWISRLVNLQSLDLSGIYLTPANKAMPTLGRLPSLVKLRLQDCGLGKTHLSNAFYNLTLLSKIQFLDLSMNVLESPIPRFFTNMSSLKFLDLSFNMFNGYIPLWLKDIIVLEFLSLRGNFFSRIEGKEVMGIIGNPCKFKGLDLSWNNVLEAKLENPPENFSKCITYDLKMLDLSNNKLAGALPSWLGDLKNIRRLNTGGNGFVGLIPPSIGSLPYLEELSLFRNGLNGTIPSSLQKLSSLEILDLSHNSLNGTVPSFLGKLHSLAHLELSNNHLKGTFPEVLGQHKTLMRISLSSNLMEGVVSDLHLANLSSLKSLDLRFNSLILNLTPEWKPPFQLVELQLSFCRIESRFPQWIRTQKQLTLMDLSNTGISGEVPEWFWKRNLAGVNLSHNHLTGPITNFSFETSYADLSYNLFSGSLPQGQLLSNGLVRTSLCHMKNLHLLDLQQNKLSGTIPDCWSADGIYAINLSSNKLSGLIPNSMGSLSSLSFLNLNNNSLEGKIPQTFSRLRGLIILDLGENKLSGEIPSYSAQSHPSLQILRLRRNQLDGVIPTELCSLQCLQILDLASNNLSGNIPHCIGRLNGMKSLPSAKNTSSTEIASPKPPPFPIEQTTMELLKGVELQYTTTLMFVVNLDVSSNSLVGSIPVDLANLSGLIGLNLSNNHLAGSIPKKIGEMRSLESLDLSNNMLSGTIPPSISELTFLSHLNLSYNKLHGEIPTGNQLQTLEDQSMIYAGNSGLCGDPLPHKCRSNNSNVQQAKEDKEQDDSRDKVELYVVIILGLATGFWGVVGSLVLLKRWRRAFYQSVDSVMYFLYDHVVTRIKRTLRI